MDGRFPRAEAGVCARAAGARAGHPTQASGAASRDARSACNATAGRRPRSGCPVASSQAVRGIGNRLRALQSCRCWHITQGDERACSSTSATAPRAPPQDSSRRFTAHAGEVTSDGHLRRNIAQRPRPAAYEEQKTGCCDGAERRHRAPRGGRGQHQLEERDRVSQTLLHRPEGTVAPVDGDEHALGNQGANRYAKPPVPVARERAPPDIRDRQQETHGDRAVDSAERARW